MPEDSTQSPPQPEPGPTPGSEAPSGSPYGATDGGTGGGTGGPCTATAEGSRNPYASTAGTAGANSARFFGWVRSLGLVRTNGWIGGVCGGVAARLGIDPIIVRGIAVVIAVLGGPAFLVYAAAWLLLPDASGDIHLERLIKGHFEPPMIGIIVLVLFSFLPFAQGFWWAGAQFWGGLSWFASVGRGLWALLVIGLIVAFIIWAARSGRFTSSSPVPPAPPTPPAQPTSSTDAGGGAAHSASASAAPASTPSAAAWVAGATVIAGTAAADTAAAGTMPSGAAPESSSSDAPSASTPTDQADVADWRARQDAWKAEYAAWNAQQADARAVKQQRSAEMRAQGLALAAEAEEARRKRRAANPRTSAAYVGIALGLALVVGGVGSAIALGSSAGPYAVPIGLAVAAALLGGSIVLAGALRRRSGFLSFVSIVVVVACLATALPPRGRDLLTPDAHYLNPTSVSGYQPVGNTTIQYNDSSAHGRADIAQGIGEVDVFIANGTSAKIVVTQHQGRDSVVANSTDADGDTQVISPTVTKSGSTTVSTLKFGKGTPTVTIAVDQGIGEVDVWRSYQ